MEFWLIWKHPISRRRYKIGTLSVSENKSLFKYSDEIGEALENGFNCFPGFESVLETYENTELFPNIASRLPNKKRPDYESILNSYGLNVGADDISILEATKGKLVTDNYEFVKAFDVSSIVFDVVGTRHCENICGVIDAMREGADVELLSDSENKYDEYALKVLLNGVHIGFVPRYYSKELTSALSNHKTYKASIDKVSFENVLSDEVVILVIKVQF